MSSEYQRDSSWKPKKRGFAVKGTSEELRKRTYPDEKKKGDLKEVSRRKDGKKGNENVITIPPPRHFQGRQGNGKRSNNPRF